MRKRRKAGTNSPEIETAIDLSSPTPAKLDGEIKALNLPGNSRTFLFFLVSSATGLDRFLILCTLLFGRFGRFGRNDFVPWRSSLRAKNTWNLPNNQPRSLPKGSHYPSRFVSLSFFPIATTPFTESVARCTASSDSRKTKGESSITGYSAACGSLGNSPLQNLFTPVLRTHALSIPLA